MLRSWQLLDQGRRDNIRNTAVVKTVYTGKINVIHGSGGTQSQIDFQYPLLGFFREKNGTATPGIIPVQAEEDFLGAAAMAALSYIIVKDTVSRFSLHTLNADLFRVDLAPANFQVLAVVLTGFVAGLRSEIFAIDYHVTVLNRVGGIRENIPFTKPILSNTPEWNGTYGAIGASPVLRGRPTETLP